MDEEVDELDLGNDLLSQNFDSICLASYRTAAKLRFIQRRTHLHLIDVWNLIEAFRENGLNSVEPCTLMTLCRFETLLATLYVHLNKRVPLAQQLDIHPASLYLMKWIVSMYNLKDDGDRLPVYTVKMVLAVLCGGKLTDKLRYIFSQASDSNGQLVMSKFDEFLRHCFSIAAAVGEEPSFRYRPGLADSVFPSMPRVSVNEFLDVMLADSGCPSLVWLPLLHRIAAAEHVVHPVECCSCGRSNFSGLRYQCVRCPAAWSHQCQECFWKGSPFCDSHKADHEVREYHTPKTAKHSTLGASLRQSLRCVRSPTSDVRDQSQAKLWRTLEGPERPVAVTYLSVSPVHLSLPSTLQRSRTLGSGDTWRSGTPAQNGSATPSMSHRSMSRGAGDDEHGLIARYAAKLAEGNSASTLGTMSDMDANASAQMLLARLESKNQEILKEIARIRCEQELNDGGSSCSGPVPLIEELAVLRQRKNELEQQLMALQDSRKHLMSQLESLMKMIKNQQLSPRSTPPSSASSPCSAATAGKISPMAPATAGHSPSDLSSSCHVDDSGRSSKLTTYDWRRDLLSAADSVTGAMSSLVQEYSADSDEGESAQELPYGQGTL